MSGEVSGLLDHASKRLFFSGVHTIRGLTSDNTV